MRRCDSAAMVPNTSELLPEPETPVNTVSRRFGSSTVTSLRLFTRAPCTRIRSWLSASCGALLIVSPSCPGGPAVDPTRSAVLQHTQNVAVRVGEGGHQPAAADVLGRVLHGAAGC